ncbi:MAG: SDR family NAD(P)-dependent oxidoreductase [Thermoleophilia bacterium]
MNVGEARILVVGGVRRLGGQIALDLAAHGANVCISTRTKDDDAEAALERLRRAGSDAHLAIGDVSWSGGAASLVNQASRALEGLDALVFAASGPFVPARPENIDEAAWNSSFDTIAKGFFAVACAARHEFAQRRTATPSSADGAGEAGVIVAITDHLGMHASAHFAAHGAAKAAQIHLVQQLARAWADEGIRVCGVAPGPVDLEDDERRAATLRAAARAAVPQLVSAADIGRGVRFCLETHAITGVNIPIDNGALLMH